VTTVPSFVNELSRKVSIHRTIWFPVIFCTLIYIILGILGAASYTISDTSNILATISDSSQGTAIGILSIIMNILFPLSVLISSIPIFSIVIRYNLIRGRICSRGNSPILSISIFPLVALNSANCRLGIILGGVFPLAISDSLSNDGTHDSGPG
jgi:hypothetical protein